MARKALHEIFSTTTFSIGFKVITCTCGWCSGLVGKGEANFQFELHQRRARKADILSRRLVK